MVTKSQKIRLGVFLFLSATVFLSLASFLAGKKLLEQKDIYYIGYKDVSVSGISVGTQVKYHGITIGNIEGVSIDPVDVTRVIIEVAIDAGTPVKEDVRAVISAIGITGIKRVELVGGTNEAGNLAPGSFITPGESSLDAITGKAEVIAEKAELLLTNMVSLTSEINRENLGLILDNTVALTSDLRNLVSDNSGRVTSIIESGGRIADNVDSLVIDARAAMEKLDVVMAGLTGVIAVVDTLGADLSEAGVQEAVARLRDAADQATLTLTHLDLTILKGRGDLLASLESLRESMDYFNEFTRMISENPSLMFRGGASSRVRDE